MASSSRSVGTVRQAGVSAAPATGSGDDGARKSRPTRATREASRMELRHDLMRSRPGAGHLRGAHTRASTRGAHGPIIGALHGASGPRPRQRDPELRLGVPDRDRRPPGPPRAVRAARGRAVDRRAPEGSVARHGTRGPRHPRPCHPGRPDPGPRPRGVRPVRQRAALPAQGAGGRGAALHPGPPQPRSGPPRLGARERRGRPRGRPPPQLPRPQPQARARQRADAVHGPQGIPAPRRGRPQPRAGGTARDRAGAGPARARADARSPCVRSSPAS